LNGFLMEDAPHPPQDAHPPKFSSVISLSSVNSHE
jgi:hypothetical protein